MWATQESCISRMDKAIITNPITWDTTHNKLRLIQRSTGTPNQPTSKCLSPHVKVRVPAKDPRRELFGTRTRINLCRILDVNREDQKLGTRHAAVLVRGLVRRTEWCVCRCYYPRGTNRGTSISKGLFGFLSPTGIKL